jgi:hypothetical protein
MKRLLLTSFSLIVIAIICYLLMAALINRSYFRDARIALSALPYLQRTGGQEYQMFNDNIGYDRPEIVVIGSSHAYRGYDPRIFQEHGLDIINTGTSSQHPLASYLLTREYWEFSSKPLYIIDVYPQIFLEDGMECTTRLIQNVPDDHIARELVLADVDMRSINAYFSRLFSDRTKIEFTAEDYVSRGYCSNPDTMKLEMTSVDSLFIGRHIYFDYLNRLISTLELNGCRMVLVNQPMPLNSNYKKFNDGFNRELEKVLKLHEGNYFTGTSDLLYYDMSQDEDFDNCCHFTDTRHLNQTGVEKFNTKLLKRLKDDGFMGVSGGEEPFSMTVHKTPSFMK